MVEVIEPSFVIEDKVNGDQILKDIERFGRTCYKSEERIMADSAAKFVRGLIKSGHESVLEHVKVTVRIICDRGVTHEIVRHRIASYSQESTRFCDYQAKGIRVIRPFFFADDPTKYRIWLSAMESCERAYNRLRELGASPQEARSVLPNSLKTEIVTTYNLREWRWFFNLRCEKKAHPQMRQITIPLLAEFQRLIPVVFDDFVIDGDRQSACLVRQTQSM